MAVSLVYETHSLTEDNASGHATGWLPGKLSAEGGKLAEELGERRRNDGVAAVLASDLARAVETATIAFSGSDIPILLDWRLRECNYGKLNGAPVAKLQGHRRDHIRDPFPGGQSYEDLVELTRSFLADLARNFDSRRVCVIAHSANKWALDVILEGRRLEDLVDAPFDWREGWEYKLPA
ncbi:MAG: histidine phosphatase family protein [Dehalococcoidia bacterium]